MSSAGNLRLFKVTQPFVVAACHESDALYACKKWHYTGRSVRLCKYIGYWEHGRFCGAMCFGTGANKNLVTMYGLEQHQVRELNRVALCSNRKAPTSRIVSAGIRLMRKAFPLLRLIVSYADPAYGHVGTIYQAMNWVYVGIGPGAVKYIIHGREYHSRHVFEKYGTNSKSALQAMFGANIAMISMPGKHKYLYPLDRRMRKQIAPLAQPYPKKALLANGEASEETQAGTT